jgi:hypothetical protein
MKFFVVVVFAGSFVEAQSDGSILVEHGLVFL